MGQTNIFECLYETYKINKPIRLIELFAGIGSQAKALENLKVDFEHWKICEWAIPSILAYNEIHQDYLPNYKVDFSKGMTKDELINYLYNVGVSSNYNEPMKYDQIKRISEGRLRKIYNAIKSENNLVNIAATKGEDLDIKDTNKYDYILCYSFPCQDLSLSGKLGGMSKDGGTRSGLLWEVERLLNESKELPQILLMENVAQVIGEKNIKDFQEWGYFLERLGYRNYVELLNAKDYGIPQNRQRCFMISILGDYNYTFPKPMQLKLKLKDMLEENVGEKYYLSIAATEGLKRKHNSTNKPICLNSKGGRKGIKGLQPSLQNRVYDSEGVATAITTGFMPSIAVLENTKKGYVEAYEGDGVYINRPHQKRGVVQREMIQTLKTSPDVGVVVAAAMRGRGKKPKQQIEISSREYANAITTVQKDSLITNNLRIRKLTPTECYALMGFTKLDKKRASKVISDSMIYHTAGDSIVVNVLMAIFGQML